MNDTIDTVLTFWFEKLKPEQWWVADDQIDQKIKSQFGQLHQQAAACELYEWRQSVAGCLAEIIILDQFSRNIYREDARAFAQDSMALTLAQEAIQHGYDRLLRAPQLAFLYLPFMHSESKIIHERAMILFDQPGLENNLDFEIRHKAVIDRFGRYPHRNAVLGRESTVDELAFLADTPSGF